MSVFLSPVGGAGAQFFDNNGNPLTGGKLYTYEAGTTTPAVTYTSVSGNTAHSNPIILDAAGRVPGSSEVWLFGSNAYKFLLKDSNDVLLGTWDNVVGIGVADAQNITYTPPFVNLVATNVELKLSEWPSVKDWGAVGDGVTDDTEAIQTAINETNGKQLLWPTGSYKVTQLDIAGTYRSMFFEGGAEILAGGTVPLDYLVSFSGLHCTFYNLNINGFFNLNYGCMLLWYNEFASSQYNSFYAPEIRYAKVGLNYGPLPPTVSTGYAQSENAMYGWRTRGVERPLVMNHQNGLLFFSAPMLVAHDEEWSAFSPGNFDYSLNHAFEAYAGVLVCEGGEIQNSIAAVTSVCARIDGGEVYLNGMAIEVDTPFQLSGSLYINGSRLLNTQSLTSQFVIAPTASASTRLHVDNCKVYRNEDVGSFSNKPLIDNTGASPNIDITFTNSEITEWASFVPIAANQQSVRFIDCKYYPNGTQDPYYAVYKMDTDGANLLDRPGIDTKGYTTDGFYLTVDYGSPSSMALSADVPNGFFEKSISVVAPGVAWASTVDPTSLATVKATGVAVTDFDKFMIEGWFKIASGGNGAVGLALFNSSGAYTAALDAFTNDQGQLSTSWKYLRAIVQIPSGSAGAYAGFGIRGQISTVLMCGLKVRRADWNIN